MNDENACKIPWTFHRKLAAGFIAAVALAGAIVLVLATQAKGVAQHKFLISYECQLTNGLITRANILQTSPAVSIGYITPVIEDMYRSNPAMKPGTLVILSISRLDP